MQINCLNLLLVLLLGIVPCKIYATDAEKNVMLYTPYIKISVPPGESINYSIDVINKCDEVKNATISVEGMPRGWNYEVKSGGFTIGELSVLPDEKKNFSLKVDVPVQVNKGTYHFTVSVDGMASLPLTVTVSKQGTYQTDFTTTQPNMEGNSKSTFTFNATIKNRTAEQQLYALTADVQRGWNVVFKPNYKQATSAQVDPNATQNITIDINPPANVAAGSYKIPVHASTGSTSTDLELEVVITGSYEMELTTPKGLLSSDITAGETKRIDLVVKNNGSAELKDIELSASKPVDWEVTFEPSKVLKLGAEQSTNVVATVKASKKALPGDYVTKMTAKTPEVNATADFRISVKTPMIWGWVGVLIIVLVLGGVYYLFRKYGRR